MKEPFTAPNILLDEKGWTEFGPASAKSPDIKFGRSQPKTLPRCSGLHLLDKIHLRRDVWNFTARDRPAGFTKSLGLPQNPLLLDWRAAALRALQLQPEQKKSHDDVNPEDVVHRWLHGNGIPKISMHKAWPEVQKLCPNWPLPNHEICLD
jgi:hypothetical protein